MTENPEIDAHSDFNSTRRNTLRIAAGVATTGIVGATSVTAQTVDRLQWEFETGGRVKSSPTVVDGTVFVGSDNLKLYAVDADTGTQQWVSESDIRVSDTSSPTVVDGTVFIGGLGHLFAVDADTGTQQWALEISRGVSSSPTIADGIVFAGGADGNLYAADANTGEQLWTFETRDTIESSPTVVDDTVYVGSGSGVRPDDTHLYAVDFETGTQQWSFETDNGVESSPTVSGDTVFIGSQDRNFYAVDADTGTQKWVFETNGRVQSSPTVVDNTVFVGDSPSDSTLGALYAIDVKTGEKKWASKIADYVQSSPTVGDKTVFILDSARAGANNKLHALDTETGDQRWDFEIGTTILSSPTLVDGTVFVGSLDNNLYAIDADIDGSSEGSRVNLGTLGHHNVWAEKNSSDGEDESDDEGSKKTLIGDTFESNHGMDPYRITTKGSDRFDWGTSRSSLPRDGSYYGYLREADSGSGTRITATSAETIQWDQSYQFEFLLRYPEYDPTAPWNDVTIGWRGDITADDGKAAENIIQLETFDTDSSGTYDGFGFQGGGVTDTSERYKIEWDPSAWYHIKGYVSEADGVAKAKIWTNSEPEPSEYQITADVTTGVSTKLPYSINIDGRRGAPITLNMAYLNWKSIETESRGSKYTDEEGYVDSEGLLDAGADYRNGEISEDRLSEVASAFRSGEPLS